MKVKELFDLVGKYSDAELVIADHESVAAAEASKAGFCNIPKNGQVVVKVVFVTKPELDPK
jgi:hypothetical protein